MRLLRVPLPLPHLPPERLELRAPQGEVRAWPPRSARCGAVCSARGGRPRAGRAREGRQRADSARVGRRCGHRELPLRRGRQWQCAPERALLELAALEPRVELPEFAARLAALLTPEERSSVRSLATRQLSRLEPEVLALHAGALGGALGALEPHEAAAPAAEVLVAKLRASTPRGKRLRCAGDEACPENARGRIRVAES